MIVALFLLAVGLGAAIHSICLATHLPKYVPGTIAFEVILSFGFSVGITVSAINGKLEDAALFGFTVLALKVIYLLDATLRGFPIMGMVAMTYKKPPMPDRRKYSC